ncbi:cingulin-like [Lepisosteus oculatus]|uniref:cingulin-like n=1 Tax=Lepisosteus oculatus TaxID=7918 RepID=UPI0035F51379
MSQCHDLVPADRQLMNDMDMFRDLLPATEKTALLFHLSYLCLAAHPELERKLRLKATESQQLFASSEVLLLQCASTGTNILGTMLPMIRTAVKKRNVELAKMFLDKSKGWIKDICHQLDRSVEKYEALGRGVGDTCRDVVEIKEDQEQQEKRKSAEAQALEGQSSKLDTSVKQLQGERDQLEKDIQDKIKELQGLIISIGERDRKFAIVAAVVPILGSMIYAIQKAVNDPKDKVALESLRVQLEELYKSKDTKVSELWQKEKELFRLQLDYAKVQINIGSIGDPSTLAEVQECLTRVKDILLQMKKFWEMTGVALDTFKQRTFTREDTLDVLEDCEKDFLSSLDEAEPIWKSFCNVCMHVRGMFILQSKEAYRFLEVSPSALSKEQWQQEYKRVVAQLDKLNPPAPRGVRVFWPE